MNKAVAVIPTTINKKRLRKNVLLAEGGLSAKPTNQTRPADFDEVKRDYCRKHHITVAELCARLERDNQFASELYRLAQAAKLTRLRSREADSC